MNKKPETIATAHTGSFKDKKIVIAGLMMDTNLGDDVLAKCVESQIKDKCEIVELDFYGRIKRCEDNTTNKKTDKLIYTKDCNFFQKCILKAIGTLRFVGLKRICYTFEVVHKP